LRCPIGCNKTTKRPAHATERATDKIPFTQSLLSFSGCDSRHRLVRLIACHSNSSTLLQHSTMVHRTWCNGKHNFLVLEKFSSPRKRRVDAPSNALHASRLTHRLQQSHSSHIGTTPPQTKQRRDQRHLTAALHCVSPCYRLRLCAPAAPLRPADKPRAAALVRVPAPPRDAAPLRPPANLPRDGAAAPRTARPPLLTRPPRLLE
jgi:hypothetical protein